MSKINKRAYLTRIVESHNKTPEGTCYFSWEDMLEYQGLKPGTHEPLFRNTYNGNIEEIVHDLGTIRTKKHYDELWTMFRLGQENPNPANN